jgi:hypothetical protein
MFYGSGLIHLSANHSPASGLELVPCARGRASGILRCYATKGCLPGEEQFYDHVHLIFPETTRGNAGGGRARIVYCRQLVALVSFGRRLTLAQQLAFTDFDRRGSAKKCASENASPRSRSAAIFRMRDHAGAKRWRSCPRRFLRRFGISLRHWPWLRRLADPAEFRPALTVRWQKEPDAIEQWSQVSQG